MLIPILFLAGWTVTATIDKMTDKPVTVMTLDATEGGAYLKVQCAGKDFAFSLNTEQPVRTSIGPRWGAPAYADGKWRLDSAKAEGITFLSRGVGPLTPASTFHNNDHGKSFFKKLEGVKQVAIQVTAAGGTVADFTFPLEGLDVGALKACYP